MIEKYGDKDFTKFCCYATSSPISEFNDAKVIILSEFEVDSNTLIISRDVYNVLIGHPLIHEIAHQAIVSDGILIITAEFLRRIIDIRNILIVDGTGVCWLGRPKPDRDGLNVSLEKGVYFRNCI